MTGAVLVTGATGKTGGALVGLLQSAGEKVRAGSRTPSTADGVRFDWHDAASHPSALDGVDRVYLVPPPSAIDPLPAVEPFLAQARMRGIRRVVMLGSAIEFPGAPGRLELAARVRAEPGWLVLSPSGFMQNFLRPHPVGRAIVERGEIDTTSPSGQVAWIDVRDVAAAAAAALTRPLIDETHPDDLVLTGPLGLSYEEAAAVIASQAGRAVRVPELDVDELSARFAAAGLPPAFAVTLAATEVDVRAGRYATATSSVLDLTGRPPRSFDEFVREHVAEWRP